MQKNKNIGYMPPFQITAEILTMVSEIFEHATVFAG